MSKFNLLVSFSFILATTIMCFAQVPKRVIDVTESNIKDNLPDIKTRSIELERIRREANKPKVSSEAKFPEIKEDFEKIQQINAEQIQKKYNDKTARNEDIAAAANQIKKYSLRLRSNLFPDDSSKKRKTNNTQTAADADKRALLIKFDNTIYHFVSNPIFKNIHLVNPDDSLKAKTDLNEIIRLSEMIIKAFG
ncbi:MAG: hypothetical protein M3033_11865 [Acidobacteriota bacterium]|nr:hypothetical protein [Acidobacteriota bacterium]